MLSMASRIERGGEEIERERELQLFNGGSVP